MWPFGTTQLEALARWRAEHPERAALALVDAHGFTAAEALDDGPTALIVGRHSEADFDLGPDASFALRHAAIVLWPKTLLIDAIDLRSESGIFARDGRRARRITRGRSLLLGMGTRDVVALAAPPGGEFPRHIDHVDALVTHALYDDPPLPGSFDIVERSRVFASRTNGVLTRNADRAPVRDSLVLPARLDDVERGLILGRYPRCDRTTTIEEDSGVSRVHAMVLMANNRLWAIDLASTNGTRIIQRNAHDVVKLGPKRRMSSLDGANGLRLGGTDVVIEIERA